MMTSNQQLELGFNGCPPRPGMRRRAARAARAQWWFTQMRAAVANAADWSGRAEPRSRQAWLPETDRRVKV